jgi:predicted alpha/beta-hydrolase family hydrolase
VASLAVAGVRVPGAAVRVPYAGLVCLSYPLHLPGRPEVAGERTALAADRRPGLLLSGAADPMARLDLLEAAMPALARGRLVTYPGLGHTLKAVRADAIDRVAAFLADLGEPVSAADR